MTPVMMLIVTMMMLLNGVVFVHNKPISSTELLGLGRLFDGFGGGIGGGPLIIPAPGAASLQGGNAGDETKTKRNAVDFLNADANFELKQQQPRVSLQSLIENVENNLWQAASGASGVAHSQTPLAEVRPEAASSSKPVRSADEDAASSHVTVRDVPTGNVITITTGAQTPAPKPTPSTPSPAHAATTDSTLLLQTTNRVPAAASVSISGGGSGGGAGGGSVLLIDRIAVQPYTGGLPPPLPAFQLLITHHNSDTDGDAADKNGAASETKLTVSDGTTTTTATTTTLPTTTTTTTQATKLLAVSTTTAAASTSAKTEKPAEPSGSEATPKTTTKRPAHEELAKAEEELKEKVAEIEAEPIILSARI